MSEQGRAVSNGIEPPKLDLPYPEDPRTITENLKKLNTLIPNERHRFLMDNLVKHLHGFINETNLTTEEWMDAIQFLTKVGQKCTPIRQEFILLSDVVGASALVDALNHPPVGTATPSTVLGPFFTEDAPDVEAGGTIASEGKGEYMFVEGRVLSTDGKPIPNAVIETWETDEFGFYDTQYAERSVPDCRGRLRSGPDGSFSYRAIVPVSYPIPGDGPVGELLLKLQRHNNRPAHLHVMIEAPGYSTLVTSLYPEGDKYLSSDAVFGVKKSLIIHLDEVNDEGQARQRGFPKGTKFKYLKFDFVMITEEEKNVARLEHEKEVRSQL